MPLQVIIAAANTVSRASVDVSEGSETISVTIRPTSITVTATARTSEPNGSPTRCATTSAWWTAASTARRPWKRPTTTSTGVGGLLPQVTTSSASASSGTTRVQRRGHATRGRAMSRTTTRAGREGAVRERKSRTAAVWSQYGQPSRSAGEAEPLGSATGASQCGHAMVPLASSSEREWRSSKCSGITQDQSRSAHVVDNEVLRVGGRPPPRPFGHS